MLKNVKKLYMIRLFISRKFRVYFCQAQLAPCWPRTVSGFCISYFFQDPKGIAELKEIKEGKADPPPPNRIRRTGGGRQLITDKYPDILSALEKLLDGNTFGDPDSPLKWTSKSTIKLAEELCREKFQVSHVTVQSLLKMLGYRLHVNKKMKQVGKESPDRDDQFNFINTNTKELINGDQPVISIDCKKKENIGNFKNN